MTEGVAALHGLARAALSEAASPHHLAEATRIVARATGSAEALIVYARDEGFLTSHAGRERRLRALSEQAVLVVQRNLTRMGSPLAYNVVAGRVEDTRRATEGVRSEHLAFHIPTTESSSEMCLLRAAGPQRVGRRLPQIVESAMPALTLLLERLVNAERGRRQKQQLEAIDTAAQVLTRAKDMKAALTDLASTIASATGFDYVSIDVYDSERRRFVLRALSENRWSKSSLAQVWLAAFDPEHPDELASGMLESHKARMIADLHHDISLSEGLRTFFKQSLLTSGAMFPMTFQDELLGTIAFVSYKPRTFPPGEVEGMQSLASQMATALKAMRMYGELARAREATQQYAGRIERQQSRMRQQAEKLRVLASTDALTGVCNYARWHATLERRLGRAAKTGAPLSVIVADVDDFKLFNDTYGHLAGDEALKAISGVIRSACRRTDVIGRCGGDEFMIILPNTEREVASRIARRILGKLEQCELRPARATEAIPLRLAVGIATFPEDGATKDALIGYADAAMYDSKGVVQGNLTIEEREEIQHDIGYPTSAFGLLDGLVRAIDRRDHFTKAHSENEARYAVLMGEALGLSDESLRALRIAGLLHDVGKVGIPDRILRKPGRLTAAERETMQQHVLITERVVAGVPHLEDVLAAASSHHERFDGTGYPRGLKADEIPLLGRLLAVADAFSAMTEDRPYRKAMPLAAAVRELRDCSGTQFDPDLVEVFISQVVPHLERRRARAA